MKESCDVVVDIWGDFAMFTRPDCKVERATYYCPTPSACRNILNAIYFKPPEFYYEITGIEIMNPIQTISVMKNEVKKVATPANIKKPGYSIISSDERTQRMNTYLRDVYYRIHAKLVKREDAPDCISISRLKAQFERRLAHGKCFTQPYFGTRECMAYFSEPDYSRDHIHDDYDFGIMLYDVFDITNNVPLNTEDKKKSCSTCVSFFNAKMCDGVVNVPAWGSDELLLRKEGEDNA